MFAGLLLLVMMVGTFSPADADISLGFDPPSQTVTVGTPFTVDLTIAGLGGGVAPSLGAFDLNVTFDSLILGYQNVVFGDPSLGDQLDLSGYGTIQITDASVAGVVNLAELSFDSIDILNSLQPASFVLARLTFDSLAAGTSTLDLTITAIGDAAGDPLAATTTGGTVTVTASVPEAGTILLLVSGLVGLGIATLKYRQG